MSCGPDEELEEEAEEHAALSAGEGIFTPQITAKKHVYTSSSVVLVVSKRSNARRSRVSSSVRFALLINSHIAHDAKDMKSKISATLMTNFVP